MVILSLQSRSKNLFKVFEAGEKSGNKSNPDEVHQLMRNSFPSKIIALISKFNLCYVISKNLGENQAIFKFITPKKCTDMA